MQVDSLFSLIDHISTDAEFFQKIAAFFFFAAFIFILQKRS